MPLLEVKDRNLAPFKRLAGGANMYEKEIEDLLCLQVAIHISALRQRSLAHQLISVRAPGRAQDAIC